MKNHLNKIRQSKGYSLLELVLVIAIVAVMVGLLLPKGFDALRTARVQQVAKTVDALKTAIVDYLALAGGNGSLPRTEGTGVPTSGAALTGATDAAKGNAARLDTVLLATGRLERPLSLRMGTQSYASAGSGN
jgi:prepilin-type N-terminal cleavage/methylation domain-containing protein